MTIFAAGKYVDKVVVDDGALKFKEKLVLTDSARYDVLLAMPL